MHDVEDELDVLLESSTMSFCTSILKLHCCEHHDWLLVVAGLQMSPYQIRDSDVDRGDITPAMRQDLDEWVGLDKQCREYSCSQAA